MQILITDSRYIIITYRYFLSVISFRGDLLRFRIAESTLQMSESERKEEFRVHPAGEIDLGAKRGVLAAVMVTRPE